jgi:hypothetical protein
LWRSQSPETVRPDEIKEVIVRIFNQNNPKQANNFVYPQWIITQLPGNKWLLVVSGVVVVDITSGQSNGWLHDTIRILPRFADAFAFAGNDVNNNTVVFETEQYATYGTLASIYDKSTAVNAGFAVDAFRPFFSDGGRGMGDGSGLDFDIAVQDVDATLFRVAYELTAVGTFVVTPLPPIL